MDSPKAKILDILWDFAMLDQIGEVEVEDTYDNIMAVLQEGERARREVHKN